MDMYLSVEKRIALLTGSISEINILQRISGAVLLIITIMPYLIQSNIIHSHSLREGWQQMIMSLFMPKWMASPVVLLAAAKTSTSIVLPLEDSYMSISFLFRCLS